MREDRIASASSFNPSTQQQQQVSAAAVSLVTVGLLFCFDCLLSLLYVRLQGMSGGKGKNWRNFLRLERVKEDRSRL